MHRSVAWSELDSFLDVLLRRGYDGGSLVIQPSGTDEHLEISKYSEGSTKGLFLELGSGVVSESLEALIKELDVQRVHYEVEREDGKQTVSGLTVDFGTDIGKANRVLEFVCTNLLNLAYKPTFDAYFKNVGHKDQ